MAESASHAPNEMLSESSSEREREVFRCRMAESAERYDDMVKYIKNVCTMTSDKLGTSERNYLSVAYKNSVGARRAALRCLVPMQARYRGKGAVVNEEIVVSYKKEVLKELADICSDLLKLVDTTILRPEVMEKRITDNVDWNEFVVFFLKMKADYYRYLSEFTEDQERTDAIGKSHSFYLEAARLATGIEDIESFADHDQAPAGGLPSPHPIRLGLMLNFSVFLYEILEQPIVAKRVARCAFDSALAKFEVADKSTVPYKDSTLILQLLRDNITLWSTHDPEEQPAGDKQDQPAAPEGNKD